ncbi:eukaryotic translation initiation factor 2A isoform X2 [Abrus precatorius]|uniref:Eukaryotic translation initiation factor 2A n=1 Tax=Abrus precatorius TaxID=3816 RepID=A0A8B8KRR5_ABRPR|nr:eukaryotic translation initiation factor 2A isoform X2 [Abrus precatorius]
MASNNQSPSLEILVRGPEDCSLWTGPPFANGQPGVKLEKVNCVNAKFSDDGSKLMVTKSNSVITIYQCDTAKEIRSFQVPNVLAAILSPSATYLQTFQKPSAPQEKNVKLWKIETGDSVYQHAQKNITKTNWPAIQFSSDETTACRLATNEVQFFDTRDFSKGVVYRLRVPGVAAVELSSTPGSHVAAFVPESKGVPASVQLFACGNVSQSQPIARRSFFRCSTTQLKWNRGSTGLLVVVQSDVDKTNQSYYGESKLCYLTTDGMHEGLVPLRKDGPIHDAQWSYSGLEFAVVYGFMPAKATVFDKKCNPLLELGTGPYNTIRWNPKGKFLCLAGFGNLPGDMVFWDYADKKQLGTTKAEWSVTSEWSPDGCYFMTATTAPRLQVDNGIKIFHYNGSLFFKKMFDKLYQADWKPESPSKFGDIAELIQSLHLVQLEDKKPSGQGPKSTQASIKASSANPPTQKPAAYRPPHAKSAAAVQAELFGESPAESMSKNALRNKKKREKQKEKKAASDASSS